jgi:hypothetical protein
MMFARLWLWVTLAIAFAAPAMANPFDGLYKPSPTTDCTVEGGDGGALRVKENVFHGIESQCRMTRPVNVRDMDGVLYDMICTGEGEEWTSRALFLRAADGGLILAWNGYAFKYDRCPTEPVAGTETTATDIGITD